MSPLKLSLFGFVSVLAFSSLGCVVYTRPRPAAVVYQSSAVVVDAPAEETVVVDSRPPADQIEDPGPPPARASVWVRGRWVYTSHGWAWRSGHWAPARAGYAWVPGHWARQHHRWVWVSGHWRTA